MCSVLCIGLMTYQITGLLLYFNNSDESAAVAKKEPGITENKNNDVDAGFQPKNEITDSPKEEKRTLIGLSPLTMPTTGYLTTQANICSGRYIE